jgi:uncharacterized membrane protein
MKLNRTIAYLIGCMALVSSFPVYVEYIYQLGFPDGHITELGYAERRLAYVFIVISFIFGSSFIYLGTGEARKRSAKQLSATIILYLLSVIGIYLINYYYRLHLDNGVGG